MKPVVFGRIGMAFSVVPLILYLSRKSRRQTGIGLFLWLNAFAGAYEFIAITIYRLDYRIWFKLDTLLEFFCLCWYFYVLVPRLKTFINILAVLFSAIFVSTVWLWVFKNLAQTDSVLCVPEMLLVYAGSITWFHGLFKRHPEKSLWQVADFYFVSGFILYFSGTLFLFLMTDFVFTQKEAGENWYINIVLMTLLNLILCIGAWKTKAE